MINGKPLIGIFPQYDRANSQVMVKESYLKMLNQAGALTCVLPLYNKHEDMVELIDMFDGFLVPGGPDILPAYFGEEPIPEFGTIEPLRDELELKLIPEIAKTNKPLLGICRGMQSINVALGGTMIQDIGAQTQPGVRVAHDQKSAHEVLTHTVRVKSKSLLGNIMGAEEIAVNSFHHQAVNAIGNDLIETAWAKDGIIEAIELKNHPFFIGVQWHPEWLVETSEYTSKLVNAFVKVAIENSTGI